ncbi:hypothetical protein A3J19_02205 [Candidatus Daviesbacteria bacterium RIFCSPLOWO2_02_FULL_41_8]|uniref:Uncharacterized protein n=3 Tax=Candidatus Daviesiibacteriota TaxID=1752718 RepID=A0A1F5NHK2_9BACT|nr:MAG: hypothetical protein A2871_01205 [Candidatus Daviesbacteria bacterium RIFCSPHIGHO2_01_FULL_41_23]OGE32660.1 MAG: hypothetical protein A3D83_01570 [Candidatus Daviesbacteria bacterium RIFCSPHIGHO2_02_FULL_41_10]OGE62512.1 MAG: hypothetical protein A2967_01690 [Candidatus Daviesbacteria bacterium RIFCSPLOWO2_01_FULL_41_32]OGE77108.1 MAG: hypothetical protein A3J19_02205 [Candidatus Daviesbacteria bacterium RIFCSPLOWO2_02_FULL_41_8]
MEQLSNLSQKVDALTRSYTLLSELLTIQSQTGAPRFDSGAMIFDMDCLITGVSRVARTRFRDMEEIGQRHLAWEIMEKIDEEHDPAL